MGVLQIFLPTIPSLLVLKDYRVLSWSVNALELGINLQLTFTSILNMWCSHTPCVNGGARVKKISEVNFQWFPACSSICCVLAYQLLRTRQTQYSNNMFFLGSNSRRILVTSLRPSGAPSHCIFCHSIRDCHASKSADGVAAAESLIFKPSDFLKHAMKHHTLVMLMKNANLGLWTFLHVDIHYSMALTCC